MIRLRVGYVITGIITGLFLVLSFFATIPDGKLHIVFCDVGQGDGIYIRFPDGKDMVVDGGPNAKIISCLSRHMPFWDRTIDMALLTHPQKDHINGLIAVLERYHVDYLVRSDVTNATDGFEKLTKLMSAKGIQEKLVTTGETITVGPTQLSVLWPSREQIASMKPAIVSKNSGNPSDSRNQIARVGQGQTLQVLGTRTTADVNDASVVFSLSYGMFDALLPGDADSRVQPRLLSLLNSRPGLELFKVPHHGSKTGLTEGFVCSVGRCHLALRQAQGKPQGDTLKRPLAVISVGQNSYGHPAPESISQLEGAGFQVLRTDKAGDIEVVSDGRAWSFSSTKKETP